MRHRKAGRRLGVPTDQRIALLRSLAEALLLHEGIKTTEPRAKELRRFVERLITISKRGDVNGRRLAMQRLPNKRIVEKLFDVYGPRYQNRPGGYTRIIKLGPRHGDNAPMARIELVQDEEETTA
ncbi:MAG TPA: 50S ribosomal protein L17 [Chloroflexota bacterium]|nr:50S ribosomal protein L17 [Chloroflexota bacterium]